MRLMRPIVERQIRRFNEEALRNLQRRFRGAARNDGLAEG